MGQRARFSQADLDKAIRVAQDRNLPVTGFRITADGEIDVRCGPQNPADDFDLTDMRR